tara:strand:+ start:6859 stop:8019 length:1161 start_codon:yes stop_codon:yes gene_type:complete
MFRNLVALALMALPLAAERSQIWSAQEMCAEAHSIVIGERVGSSKVRVEEWLMEPPDGHKAGQFIEIIGLEKNQKVVVVPGLAQKAQGPVSWRVKSQRLMCFLVEKGGRWQAMAQGEAGSSGLVWIEEGRCYVYQQIKDQDGPGHTAYSLVASRFCQTEAQLLARVRQGLGDRKKWEEVLAIENPEEQAIVLCSYLLRRTSPESEYGTYRKRVRTLLSSLGEYAVGELVILLRNATEGDKLDEAVLILKDLGSLAKPAVLDIVQLLQNPGSVDSAIAIEALGRIGDATVAPHLLAFLTDTLAVRAEVAGAMAQFGYRDSIKLLEKALPDSDAVNAEDAHHIYTMLQALHELGSEEAPRLTANYLRVPAMGHMHNLLEPFLQGPAEE